MGACARKYPEHRKEGLVWLFLGSLLACLLCHAGYPLHLHAQDVIKEVTSPRSPLLHRVPQEKELPTPGKVMVLDFSVEGQRDLELRAQALVTRDGKLMIVPVSRVFLNENDQATYEFNVYAPLAEMSYFFVLYPRDGTVPTSSRRYAIRRSCLPNLELTQLTPPQPDKQSGELERMRELLTQARGLEVDLENYENALKLLKEINSGVPE